MHRRWIRGRLERVSVGSGVDVSGVVGIFQVDASMQA